MNQKKQSYRNTAMLGISSVINILLSIIRNKFFSVFLGPVGIGQFGILNDFINSVFVIGSFGMSNSGVQAISQASTDPNGSVRRVYNSLRLIFTFVSIVLILTTVLFAGRISIWLSGGTELAIYLRISAFALLLKFHSALQNLLITGLRRIKQLALANIFQGCLATAGGIILVFFLRGSAIPFLILLIALGGWVISYYQSRSILKDIPSDSSRMSTAELKPIFILGISTLWAGFLESGVNLVNKSWITRFFGKEYLGFYQVAVGFTTSYISFITTSIITYYYPNLAIKAKGSIQDFNEYVNQQLTISMALIMPLLLIMLTYSKLFLVFLFSSKFLPASSLLSYTVAGTFIQVVAWPIAYVFLAHNATKVYIFTESVGNGAMLLLSYFATRSGVFDLIGSAYVLHYVIYLILIIYLFLKKFSGAIIRENIESFFMNASIIVLVFVAKLFFDDTYVYVIGSLAILYYFYKSREEYILMFNTFFKKNDR